jgi:O-antigen/teichoic acid export membrane protein
MCLGLSLFDGEIVAIVAPARYASAAVVVPIVLSAYFLGSQYKTFVLLLSYHKRTLVISLGSILQAAVNLGANILLIPRFGKIAAAWTTLIALAIYLLWLFIWSQKNFYLKLDYRRIAAITVVIAVAAGVAALLLSLPQVAGSLALTIGVKGVLLLGVAALTWFAGLILPVDKRQIKSFLRLT